MGGTAVGGGDVPTILLRLQKLWNRHCHINFGQMA